MSYLALYRRYRPKTFDQLIGQEHIVKTLKNQIASDRLGHAYLFTGTRGTGKTTVAKIFAKAINCENAKDGSPCFECKTCKALEDASNIDIIEIDAASNNGVNEIRELRENVQYPPISCKYKVYIIDEVHMLTGAAFNALLKTLEEPPKHAVFILATTESHKIPATILSRCMRFDFRLVATEKIAELIGKIFDEENKKYQKEAVFAIAKAGEGSVRDALSIADTAISYSKGELTYEDVMEILGSSNGELINGFVKAMLTGNSGEVLKIIDELSKLGKSMGVLVKDVTSCLRDVLIVKTCDNANSVLTLPEQKFEELKNIASLCNEEKILRCMQILSETETELKYSTHPRIVFERSAVKATRPDTDYSIDALIERVKTLEEKLKGGIIQTQVAETRENKVAENTEISLETSTEQKISVKDMDGEVLKGKILYNLRKNGSLMLLNVMDEIKVETENKNVIIIPMDKSDYEILIREENYNKLKVALNDYEVNEIIIREDFGKTKEAEMDDATDNVKKIFGDDIVIVKS